MIRCPAGERIGQLPSLCRALAYQVQAIAAVSDEAIRDWGELLEGPHVVHDEKADFLLQPIRRELVELAEFAGRALRDLATPPLDSRRN